MNDRFPSGDRGASASVKAKKIDIVLPAHNEAASIAETLREFYEVSHQRFGLDVRFVVCEDGSSDGTADVLRGLQAELPIKLITGPERKGYSRAVIDGIVASEAEVVGFIDSDGQCDPMDLERLHKALPGHDMVIGRRSPRQDAPVRLLMSRSFGLAFLLLFGKTVRDPSCPYILIRRPTLERIMHGSVGVLKQGFWWEFVARAKAAGADITEVNVHHRARAAGQTQVYRATKVPGIAAKHLLGLLALRRELYPPAKAKDARDAT